MQSFDFVVAVNTLVAGVKPELIQTCFHTAGFMTYVHPPPGSLPEPPRNIWERMQNIFDVNCTFEEYETADDHAESSQPMTDENIINAVRNHNSPSESESSTLEDPDLTPDDDVDAESNEDGVAANESQIIHTSNQFLHILDQMKTYALRSQLSWKAHTNIDNLRSILVQSKVRVAHIQTDISPYFNSPKQWISAGICVQIHVFSLHFVCKYMHMYLLFIKYVNEKYPCFSMSKNTNKYLLNKNVFNQYVTQIFQEISFKISSRIQPPSTST